MSASSSSVVNGPMTELPEPDAIARAHSQRLHERLLQRIGREGPVSFASYMQQVLYEPGLGYYMAGAAKFGADGDFITAPELTPLFGASLAHEIGAVLAHLGGGVLELGAGSGKLALSILQHLDATDIHSYTILEPSAELVQRQRRLLCEQLAADVFAKVEWINQLPDAFTGVIVANEVMDALPVERFTIAGNSNGVPGSVEQCFVTDRLTTVQQPATTALQLAVEAIQAALETPLPVGYNSEVCLLLKPWLSSLAECLQQGVMLLIDYGYPRREYYLPERLQGTLACYYQHRAHDNPFRWPGLQDITAHVDFTAVAEAAVDNQLDILGYASQAAFLLDNALLEKSDAYQRGLNSEVDRIEAARAVKTLTLPGEMGERFQVMALGKGYDLALSGFRTQDLTYRL